MRMRNISSGKNQVIKEIRLLGEKRERDKKALFFVEGIKFVIDGLISGWDVERMIVSESFKASADFNRIDELCGENTPVYLVPDKLFDSISDTSTPQGVLAVFRQKRYERTDILKGNRLIVILDSVQDPGNMGTIIRTADAASFSGVICLKGCVDVYNPKVIRSTAGSIFQIPVVRNAEAGETANYLKDCGIRIYATGTDYPLNPYDVDLRRDVAFIIGNEASGITHEADSLSGGGISLPIPGKAESLNASVAAGIIMYESVRQRRQQLIKQV
jgi:TrmH family RNA methyltransferase